MLQSNDPFTAWEVQLSSTCFSLWRDRFKLTHFSSWELQIRGTSGVICCLCGKLEQSGFDPNSINSSSQLEESSLPLWVFTGTGLINGLSIPHNVTLFHYKGFLDGSWQKKASKQIYCSVIKLRLLSESLCQKWNSIRGKKCGPENRASSSSTTNQSN